MTPHRCQVSRQGARTPTIESGSTWHTASPIQINDLKRGCNCKRRTPTWSRGCFRCDWKGRTTGGCRAALPCRPAHYSERRCSACAQDLLPPSRRGFAAHASGARQRVSDHCGIHPEAELKPSPAYRSTNPSVSTGRDRHTHQPDGRPASPAGRHLLRCAKPWRGTARVGLSLPWLLRDTLAHSLADLVVQPL